MDVSLVDVDVGSESAWSVVAVEANLGVAERTTAGFARLAFATGDNRFTTEEKESVWRRDREEKGERIVKGHQEEETEEGKTENAHTNLRSLLELRRIDSLPNLLNYAREFVSQCRRNSRVGERVRRTNGAASEGAFVTFVEVAVGLLSGR